MASAVAFKRRYNPMSNSNQFPANLAAPRAASSTAPRVVDAKTRRKVIAASFVGNFVEWFETTRPTATWP